MPSFDPDNFKQNYKFLIGSVQPRPIAVVSTLNENGSNNLAPFSFFTAVSADPMIVAFCPFIRSSDGEKKDTVKNIEREKEFVINFATKKNYKQINLASTELPYGDDEFIFSNLTPVKSELVKAKRVKESPINFECKLRDIISYGETIGSGRIITGEVVKIHVDENIFDEGKILTDKFQPVGRGVGNEWWGPGDIFQLERLMKTQIQK